MTLKLNHFYCYTAGDRTPPLLQYSNVLRTQLLLCTNIHTQTHAALNHMIEQCGVFVAELSIERLNPLYG